MFHSYRYNFVRLTLPGLKWIAVTTWNESKHDVKDNGTNLGLHIDFRIGGGFKGDKFMLYFWSVCNWFSIENYYDPEDPDNPEDQLIINGIWGLGVSYYFKPTSPSLYINAGIGFSKWEGTLILGVGVMGGIGYEFTRHWSVEFGVMWCNDIQDFAIQFESSYVDSLAISLSIIGIAY